MTDNQNEKRKARLIQSTLKVPYTAALRMLRQGVVAVRDGQVIDYREGK